MVSPTSSMRERKTSFTVVVEPYTPVPIDVAMEKRSRWKLRVVAEKVLQ